MHFAGTVVLEHGQNADRGQHHGKAGALGGVLAETQEHDHGGNEHKATAHAHEAGGHACEQTNGEKHQQSQGIKGHDGEIQKSKFKDKVKRRGKVIPSSTP